MTVSLSAQCRNDLAIVLAAGHCQEALLQRLGFVVGQGPHRQQRLHAQRHVLGQLLHAQPLAVGLPARPRRRAAAPVLLQQTANADLRPLALLDRLAVGPHDLPSLVIGTLRNVDAFERSFLQLARHAADIEPVGLDRQARWSLHAARRNHRHRDLLFPRPPRQLVAEPARFEREVHRTSRVASHQRLQVLEVAPRAQPQPLCPLPPHAVDPLRAR
jgi:hypothetical protein